MGRSWYEGEQGAGMRREQGASRRGRSWYVWMSWCVGEELTYEGGAVRLT